MKTYIEFRGLEFQALGRSGHCCQHCKEGRKGREPAAVSIRIGPGDDPSYVCRACFERGRDKDGPDIEDLRELIEWPPK